MAYTPIPTTIGMILSLIRDRLVCSFILPSNCVYCCMTEQPNETPPNDQYIIVSPKPIPPDQGCVTGGGNTLMLMDSAVMVTIYSRLALDQTPRDDYWLTPSSGYSVDLIQQKVVASLQLFFPADDNSNFYMAEPMRLTDYSEPLRDSPPGWGSVKLRYDVQYIENLS